ncbi:putative tellurium resistance membrane protein TerC [Mucilaginibacter sp. UYNi724]
MNRFKITLLLFLTLLAGAFIFYFYSYKSNSFYIVVASVAMAIGFLGLGINWFSLNVHFNRMLEIVAWCIYLLVGMGLFIELLIQEGMREKRMLSAYGIKVMQ